MFEGSSISIVIPALNEEQAIPQVIGSLPAWVDEVVVVDNGSTDATASVAAKCGARVVHEPRRGYGAACLAGIAATASPDIIVFLDGDGSDDPKEMERIVAPVAAGEAELVIGSRTLGTPQRGSVTIQQRLGNALACFLMRTLWKVRYTDLGPFRAIRADALGRLGMTDCAYGWTVQMQIRAIKARLRVKEAAVSYRRRIGRSKISGTLRGAIGAGVKILYVVARERLSPDSPPAAVCPNHLIVFLRFPEAGSAKTRLIPALGPQGAATLARQMADSTLSRLAKLADFDVCSVEVRITGARRAAFREAFGGHYEYRGQGEGDLGQRLNRAATEAFACGARKVVMVGTDCPDLGPDHIIDAFLRLEKHDTVVGPAVDGGYYLWAARRVLPDLFMGIDWGSSKVLDQTREAAVRAGASIDILGELHDVDVRGDLPVWERRVAVDRGVQPSVSVIIPAFNEEGMIVSAIRSAAGGTGVEAIVVDGGSSDRTVAMTQEAGARLVHSDRGRARQMNAGAACAKGTVLLFLHADSVLPSGFADQAVRALADRDTALVAFRLSIDSPRRSLKWVARLANARSRLGLPYGDQVFAVRADLFRRIGGYRDLPILEDFELARRIRRHGSIRILDSHVTTSPRRWHHNGVFKMTIVNQLCILGFKLGIDPNRLARFRNPVGCGRLDAVRQPNMDSGFARVESIAEERQCLESSSPC